MAVRRIAVPEGVDGGADADFGCAFAASGVAARSALGWARATFEGPPVLSRVLYLAWRFGLGFRLGPRGTDGYVLGCSVVSADDDVVVLEMRSPLMVAHNVVLRDAAGARWVTLVWYRSWLARPLWAVAALVHCRVLPYLLGRASRGRDQPGS